MAYKDYLEVDIEKPVSTFVDLTNYFQARVGDAKAYCKLHIKSGSNSIDMTNKKMTFYGKDSNATPFVAAGGFDDVCRAMTKTPMTAQINAMTGN